MEATEEGMLILRELGCGKIQPDYYYKLELPTFNPTINKLWTSGGWNDLPTATGHMDKDREKRIVSAIYRELNASLALDLDSNPLLAREIGAGNRPGLQTNSSSSAACWLACSANQ